MAATILLPQVIVALVRPGSAAPLNAPAAARCFFWVGDWCRCRGCSTRPGLVPGQILNGMSSAVFGVMMTLVAADLTRGKGQFNLALGTLGVAISIGASLSTFLTGIAAATLGARVAYAGLTLAGLAGVLLLWLRMPETHMPATNAPESVSAK